MRLRVLEPDSQMLPARHPPSSPSRWKSCPMSGVVDVGRSDRRPLRPQPAPIPTVAIVLGELPTPNTSQPRRPESAIAGAGLMLTASGIYLTWWRLRYGKNIGALIRPNRRRRHEIHRPHAEMGPAIVNVVSRDGRNRRFQTAIVAEVRADVAFSSKRLPIGCGSRSGRSAGGLRNR